MILWRTLRKRRSPAGAHLVSVALAMAISAVVWESTPVMAQYETLGAKISSASAGDAANVVAQNLALIIAVKEGTVDAKKLSESLLADTEAALKVVEQYQTFKRIELAHKIADLDLTLKSLRLRHAAAGASEADAVLDQVIEARYNLTRAYDQMGAAKSSAANLSKTLKAVNYIGNGLNLLDTGLKGRDLYNAFQSDASTFTKNMAGAELGISAVTTELAIAGSAAAPWVAATKAVVDMGVWYHDIFGSAVSTEVQERTEAVYEIIKAAHLKVQNKIIALHKAGQSPSDEDVAAIAMKEYREARMEVESLRKDIGLAEFFMGQKKVSHKAIDDALSMIDILLDGKAEARAVKFNRELSENQRTIEETRAIIGDAIGILNDVKASIPRDFEAIVAGSADHPAIIVALPETAVEDSVNLNLKQDLASRSSNQQARFPFIGMLSYFSRTNHEFAPGHFSEGISEEHKGAMPVDGTGTPANPSAGGSVIFKNIGGDVGTFNVQSAPSNQNRYGSGVFLNLAGHNRDAYQYSHTAWGKWNGSLAETWDDGTQSSASKGYWVAGSYTPSAVVDAKSGNATYYGALMGDFVAAGSSIVEQGVAFGSINLDMDFASNRLDGSMTILLNRSGSTSLWLNPSISNGTVSPYFSEHGSETIGPVFYADVGDQTGFVEGQGPGLVGFFFGPDGSEVGGAFDAAKQSGLNAGTVNGIFRAKEQ